MELLLRIDIKEAEKQMLGTSGQTMNFCLIRLEVFLRISFSMFGEKESRVKTNPYLLIQNLPKLLNSPCTKHWMKHSNQTVFI